MLSFRGAGDSPRTRNPDKKWLLRTWIPDRALLRASGMTVWRAYAARRSLCLPSKFGATSRMKRSISSLTWVCGFMPTLK